MELGSTSLGSIELGGVLASNTFPPPQPPVLAGALAGSIYQISMPQAAVSNIASGNVFSQSQSVPANLGI